MHARVLGHISIEVNKEAIVESWKAVSLQHCSSKKE